MARKMDEARMAAILAAYGADPAHWPSDERDAAGAWLVAHPDRLTVERDEARAVDTALALDRRDAVVSDALAARVSAGIPGKGAAGGTVTPFRLRGRSGATRNAGAIAALAACAVLGVVLGFSTAARPDDSAADADAVFGAAFDPGPAGGDG